jgi:nucleoside 2-deoxyribosyltransferase
MTIVYKAPELVPIDMGDFRIFLAGSIDMGKAENWQERLERELAEYEDDVIICNPRRDDWDSTWVQSINNPQFNEQVTWELENIEDADLVVFYFDPNGQAPITLMELGLVAGSEIPAIVCCPDGYWRKGNVEMICDRYGIPLCANIDDFIALIKEEF